MSETRFFYFASVFRGYTFINKETKSPISKAGIYFRFFKHYYPNSFNDMGNALAPEFASPELETEFFAICTMFGKKILKINKHHEIEIKDSVGWKDGEIVEREKVFFIERLWNLQNHDTDVVT